MLTVVVAVVVTLALIECDPCGHSEIRLHRAVWILVNRRRPR